MRNQSVTNGQQRVARESVSETHTPLGHADGKTAHDIDHGDDHRRHGITSNKLRSTVHGSVKVGFLLHLTPAGPRLLFIDNPSAQLGIDGHLLARHGVQGKTGRHFSDTACTLGDDHKVDDHQDGEDDDTHHVIATDDKVTKGLNNMSGIAVDEDQPSGGHIEGQPKQGDEEQQGRKHGELRRILGVEDDQQDEQRRSDADRQEQIQQQRRHRQNEQQHRAKHAHHQPEVHLAQANQPTVLCFCHRVRFRTDQKQLSIQVDFMPFLLGFIEFSTPDPANSAGSLEPELLRPHRQSPRSRVIDKVTPHPTPNRLDPARVPVRESLQNWRPDRGGNLLWGL